MSEQFKEVEEYLQWAKKTIDESIPKLSDELQDKFLLNVEDVLRGGKRFRAALTLLSAQAIAGEDAWKKAEDYALSVELIHSFSLNVDDILDIDEIRRGKPSEWVMFGLIPAFLSGIGGITQAFSLGSKNVKAMKVLNETIQAMASGAVKEMVTGNVFKRDFLINIIILKTGALMATASEMGAIAVDAPSTVEEAFRKYGLNVGIAYQMQDDLNDIILSMREGTPHGDLKEYRLTMPLYIIHESVPSLADVIDMFLMRKISFNNFADKIASAGGTKIFDNVNNEIENYIGKAIHALNGLELEDKYRSILEDLPYYMVNAMRAEMSKKIVESLNKKVEKPENNELEEKKVEEEGLLPFNEWMLTLPASQIAAVTLLQSEMDDNEIISKTGVTEKELTHLKDVLIKYGKIQGGQ